MMSIRGTAGFVGVALAMALWTGALGTFPGIAEAGVIASHGGGTDLRAADLAKVQAFLERKVIVQRLVDYGVSPRDALSRIGAMDGKELHRLAALTDRAPAGSDGGLDVAVGLAVLFILILIILMLLHKKVVIR